MLHRPMLFGLLSSCLSLSTFALSAEPGYEVEVLSANVDRVYIPPHYDSNDLVQLVATGILPNACYSLATATANVDALNRVIEVEVEAYHYKKDICTEVEITFAETIAIGMLPAGTYAVKWIGTDATKSKVAQQQSFVVTEAKKESVDDFLYAPVDIIDHDEAGKLVLKGRFPNLFRGCMKVVETLISELEDIVVVQPIAAVFPDEQCSETEAATLDFIVHTNLKVDFAQKTLVHVRTLNGHSLNKVYGL